MGYRSWGTWGWGSGIRVSGSQFRGWGEGSCVSGLREGLEYGSRVRVGVAWGWGRFGVKRVGVTLGLKNGLWGPPPWRIWRRGASMSHACTAQHQGSCLESGGWPLSRKPDTDKTVTFAFRGKSSKPCTVFPFRSEADAGLGECFEREYVPRMYDWEAVTKPHGMTNSMEFDPLPRQI